VPAGHGRHTEGCPVQDEPAGHVKGPESTPTDGPPADVLIAMPLVTFAPLLPIVNPLIVIVHAEDEAMDEPAIVMTKAVAEVMPHVAVRLSTLLAPAATVGVLEDAKKLEG
jgi:hypothetical protein